MRERGMRQVGDEEVAAGAPVDMDRRWRSEAEFFDGVASRLWERAQPLSDAEVDRYRRPNRPWFSKEYCFRLLGDVRGARILDLACGAGSSSILLARLGATVTGFDLSRKSIELAVHRAKLSGVSSRTQFLCAAAEAVSFPDDSFDVIWGDGVLHHLIEVLDFVLKKASRWVHPGGRAIFSEPVCLSPVLRRLRRHVPVHTDATPDERPLQGAEMEVIRRYVPDVRLRWFNLFGRFNRFVLAEPLNYERSSLSRRLAANALALADWPLLSLPGLRELGSVVTLSGTFAR